MTGASAAWRSIDQLDGSEEFRRLAANEFVTEDASVLELDGVSRRRFLQVLGASSLLTLPACDLIRRPVENILPYGKRPETLLPGRPVHYATCFTRGGVATPLLAVSHDGRPIKLEGNPEHPASGGSTDLQMQAALLGLYDPDRSRVLKCGGQESDGAAFSAFLDQQRKGWKATGGRGLAVISEAQGSPCFQALRARFFQTFPEAKDLWVTYEPLARDAIYEGARLALGQAAETQIRFERADVIVALDHDFLTADLDSLRSARGFADRRRVSVPGDKTAGMNRLYAVEPHFTATGSLADHRLRLRASEVRLFALALAVELELPGLPSFLSEAYRAATLSFDRAWAREVARDLKAAGRGRAVVTAGPRQPVSVQALVHHLNHALGAQGGLVTYRPLPDPRLDCGLENLARLAAAMQAGQVETLVVLGGNPVYNAPADLELKVALARVGQVLRLGDHEDETSASASWHLPRAHFLEAWGDGRSLDGARLLQQPLIAPLYEGRSDLEFLAELIDGGAPRGHDLLRAHWRAESGVADEAGFERAFRGLLHQGWAELEGAKPLVLAPSEGSLAALCQREFKDRAFARAAAGLELAFAPCAKVHDGRYADNAWLQECPDPISKLTWDNALIMSERQAKALKFQNGDIVRAKVGQRRLEAAVFVLPGHVDGAATLALGYGRTRAGAVATGAGFDAYALRTRHSMGWAAEVQFEKIGQGYRFACTQDHHYMRGTVEAIGYQEAQDRPLVRSATLAAYLAAKPGEDPFLPPQAPHPPRESLFDEPRYDQGQQWAMTIDLNSCNGCNACLVACQAENNIPTVGKDQVARGREMHWIRLDRYFVGDRDEPEMVHQPVNCQQCELAPCETVCPVAATTHSPSGLNDMVYNRCIGTRYCSNNCPVKVRRFNYYNFAARSMETQPLPLAQNPDVTVRFRGVMEKCTYCVQRINRAVFDAKNAGRDRVADGTIQTACEQVCPTRAIAFGDRNDPRSRVSLLKAQGPRNYEILEELNLKARTTFLARLRNPNPELVAALQKGGKPS